MTGMTTPDIYEVVRTFVTGGVGVLFLAILKKVWNLASLAATGQAQMAQNQIEIKDLAKRVDKSIDRITLLLEQHDARIRDNEKDIAGLLAINDHRRPE